jgi:quercetin dioxygenase-like cupin family protein
MFEGVRRRIVADGDRLMLIYVELAQNAVVPEHHHIHEQITYLLSGKVEFTVGGQTSILLPGQSAHMAPNVPHKVVALEASVVIDAFSPPREDFRT